MLIGNDTGVPRGRDTSPDDTFCVSNPREGAAEPFRRLSFHSDAMWSDEPPLVLSLAAVDVEQPVTPTIFASALHACLTTSVRASSRSARCTSPVRTARRAPRQGPQSDVRATQLSGALPDVVSRCDE
jgi:hypothetical protein